MSSTNESGSSSKRKRAANFTELETRILVDVVLRHAAVIENKRSDSVSWKQKSDTWTIIANQFNSLTGERNRPAKELRLKYECLKRNIKKKQTHNKYEMHFKTGGGSADLKKFTDYEEKSLNHIMLSVEGLIPEDDCDANLDQVPNSSVTPTVFNVITPVTNTEITSEAQTAATVFNIQTPTAATVCNLTQETMSETNTDNPLSPRLFETSNNEIAADHGECSGSNTLTILDANPIEENEAPRRTPQTWSKWSSSQLKQTKHKALTSKTRKPIKKDTLNEKIVEVTDSRQELLLLQIKIAKEDLKHKQEEHAEKINVMRSEQEGLAAKQEFRRREHQLKEELLQIKIKNKKFKQQLLELEIQSLLTS